MLKKVYQTAPFTYAPHDVKINFLWGISTLLNPLADSSRTLYLFAATIVNDEIGSIGASRWDFDGVSGAYLQETRYTVGVLFGGTFFQGRSGNFYHTFSPPDSFIATDPLTLQDSGNVYHDSFYSSGYWSRIAIDELEDFLVSTSAFDLTNVQINRLSTGVVLGNVFMPASVLSICLQEDRFAYILCGNGMLVLLNYFNQTIAGVSRMPPSLSGTSGSWSDASCVMCWDSTFQRLYVGEQLPDVAGEPTTTVRGFSVQPFATRLCTPIPLQTPLKGEVIRVVTQVVDDCNSNIGAGLVNAIVTGGTLVGSGSTLANGATIFEVSCDNTGSVEIDCSVTVPLVGD